MEERQRAFEARASDIRGRARNIAARSNQLGKSTAAEMRAIAGAVAIAPGASGFSCYDPTLAERLRQAAAQAEQPAELKLREAVFSEGPAGWRCGQNRGNIGAYSPARAYLSSGGKQTVGHTDGGEPITGPDLIALLATIGIHLGLLARRLSIRRGKTIVRFWGRCDDRSTGVDAIARAADREWVHRHFVNHHSVPSGHRIRAVDPTRDGIQRALAMNSSPAC